MSFHKLKALKAKYFERWLSKRMPTVKQITLDRSNTFIFPSRFGCMLLATCLVMFLIGTNYQNNLILLLVFFLLSFMVTCLLFSYQNLSGLNLATVASDDQFTGQAAIFRLRINAKKGGAQQTQYFFKNNTSNIKSVVDQQSVQLFAKSTQRGWFKPGRVTVQSYYPFGLFKVWTYLDFGFSCLLYPAPLENKLQNITLSGKETAIGGHQKKVGFDTFNHLKPFQQGESLKSIAWKQVAQGKGFFTKQFEQEIGGDVYLSLSALKTVSLEDKLAMLTYQVINYQQQGVRYGLDLGQVVIKVDTGANHQTTCLRAIALYGLNNA